MSFQIKKTILFTLFILSSQSKDHFIELDLANQDKSSLPISETHQIHYRFLAADTCPSICVHCVSCPDKGQWCTTDCESGYENDPAALKCAKQCVKSTSTCTDLDANCEECKTDEPTQCKECKDKYVFKDGQLCEKCTDAYPDCKTCSQKKDECTDCDANFHLEGKECVADEDCDDPNCIACDTDKKVCTECNTKYYVKDSACKECDIKNCDECSVEDKCTKAAAGYYIDDDDDDKVKECLSGCKTCDNGKKCLTCDGDDTIDENDLCPSSHVGVIIGCVIGVIGCLVVGFFGFKWQKKRQALKLEQQNNDVSETDANELKKSISVSAVSEKQIEKEDSNEPRMNIY